MSDTKEEPDLMKEFDTEAYQRRFEKAVLYRELGRVQKSVGLVYEARLARASVGSMCTIMMSHKIRESSGFDCEIIGFNGNRAIIMPLEEPKHVNNECLVRIKEEDSSVRVADGLLGRVINAKGDPIDGKGPIDFEEIVESRELYAQPSDPMARKRIEEPLDLGVRAINGLLTCGRGQRMGIFAGSGVGKSVLLGMMAQNTNADVNVIALIGERTREVREFIENELGEEGLRRSVVVVATSDASPLLRMRGAYVATTIAEYFRDQGKNVLLMMDSLTRFCMAQREIGLSLGEPPTTKGYTPSVFSRLPRLLERAGTTPHEGSITGLYTVLVEGDEMDDPIADSARSILDGHIVLSRKLASKNHYPAIDVLNSSSRVMPHVISREHKSWAGKIKEWIATYQEVEDLINLGAYVRGANAKIDEAVLVHSRIQSFSRQDSTDRANLADTTALMHAIERYAESYGQSLSSPEPVSQAPRDNGFRF